MMVNNNCLKLFFLAEILFFLNVGESSSHRPESSGRLCSQIRSWSQYYGSCLAGVTWRDDSLHLGLRQICSLTTEYRFFFEAFTCHVDCQPQNICFFPNDKNYFPSLLFVVKSHMILIRLLNERIARLSSLEMGRYDEQIITFQRFEREGVIAAIQRPKEGVSGFSSATNSTIGPCPTALKNEASFVIA